MNKYQKRGLLLVVLGLILVAISLGIHAMQEKQDQIAGANAQILLEHMKLNKPSMNVTVDTPSFEDTPGQETAPQEETVPVVDTSMPTKEYLGYTMIGTLRVPDVGIELPIMSTWSYDLLNVAPCRYSGSIGGGDLIILGHNYRSHFTPLHQTRVGDTVEFEDANGVKYQYVVEAIEYLHKSEGERLPSDYALSLFTCTADGQSRVVIRCNPAA